MKKSRWAFLAGFMTGAVCLSATGTAQAAPPLRCEEVTFFVALAPGQPADQSLFAEVCARGTIQGKTIQVLIHGGASNHLYWDFPYKPQKYSYVEAITARGYAVVNLDRLGVGQSSRPVPGAWLSLYTAAYTVHQVVQVLRHGNLIVPHLGKIRAQRVILVGHSMGSLTSTVVASQYGGVDGIILSGYAQLPGGEYPLLMTLVYPAFNDPKFASSGLPADYFTFVPGGIGQVFFELSNTDPKALAVAEQIKDTVTLGELISVDQTRFASKGVHVPTLVVVGDLDFVVCPFPSCTANDVVSFTQAQFPATTCLEVEVIPGASHYLNMELNAPDWYEIAADWANRRIGVSSRAPATNPCP